jgi:hypothetical protein
MVFRTLLISEFALIATDLEIAREHVHEVVRPHTKHYFVSVVLPNVFIVDLLDLDIGEGGVVEESVTITS